MIRLNRIPLLALLLALAACIAVHAQGPLCSDVIAKDDRIEKDFSTAISAIPVDSILSSTIVLSDSTVAATEFSPIFSSVTDTNTVISIRGTPASGTFTSIVTAPLISQTTQTALISATASVSVSSVITSGGVGTTVSVGSPVIVVSSTVTNTVFSSSFVTTPTAISSSPLFFMAVSTTVAGPTVTPVQVSTSNVRVPSSFLTLPLSIQTSISASVIVTATITISTDITPNEVSSTTSIGMSITGSPICVSLLGDSVCVSVSIPTTLTSLTLIDNGTCLVDALGLCVISSDCVLGADLSCIVTNPIPTLTSIVASLTADPVCVSLLGGSVCVSLSIPTTSSLLTLTDVGTCLIDPLGVCVLTSDCVLGVDGSCILSSPVQTLTSIIASVTASPVCVSLLGDSICASVSLPTTSTLLDVTLSGSCIVNALGVCVGIETNSCVLNVLGNCLPPAQLTTALVSVLGDPLCLTSDPLSLLCLVASTPTITSILTLTQTATDGCLLNALGLCVDVTSDCVLGLLGQCLLDVSVSVPTTSATGVIGTVGELVANFLADPLCLDPLTLLGVSVCASVTTPTTASTLTLISDTNQGCLVNALGLCIDIATSGCVLDLALGQCLLDFGTTPSLTAIPASIAADPTCVSSDALNLACLSFSTPTTSGLLTLTVESTCLVNLLGLCVSTETPNCVVDLLGLCVPDLLGGGSSTPSVLFATSSVTTILQSVQLQATCASATPLLDLLGLPIGQVCVSSVTPTTVNSLVGTATSGATCLLNSVGDCFATPTCVLNLLGLCIL